MPASNQAPGPVRALVESALRWGYGKEVDSIRAAADALDAAVRWPVGEQAAQQLARALHQIWGITDIGTGAYWHDMAAAVLAKLEKHNG